MQPKSTIYGMNDVNYGNNNKIRLEDSVNPPYFVENFHL